MTSRNPLGEYISRLIHQALVQVTGGLGFLLTVSLELIFPGSIIKWLFYLILLIAGLVVGGYQVFADLLKEHSKERDNLTQQIDLLKLKIRELEEKRPRITVRILDHSGRPTQRILLSLTSLPPAPIFEDEIAEKRNELLARKQARQSASDSGLRIILDLEGLNRLNPDYDREVEKYLEEYRKYLIEKYECSIASDRLRSIELTVENQGLYPATDVTIELTMPKGYREPSENQRLIKRSAEIGEDYTPSPPQEPTLTISLLGSDWNKIRIDPLFFPDLEISNTSGPDITSRDGTNLITYHIKKIIQNRPESDFGPLLVWLGDVKESTTWEITVKIYAAELPVPLSETLWLELKI